VTFSVGRARALSARPSLLGRHVDRAVVSPGARLVVARGLAGVRKVDPVCLGASDVDVHEGAVRVVAAAGVAERDAEVEKSTRSSFFTPRTRKSRALPSLWFERAVYCVGV
jgi:hypothetical protein